jgi:hypothetical protein
MNPCFPEEHMKQSAVIALVVALVGAPGCTVDGLDPAAPDTPPQFNARKPGGGGGKDWTARFSLSDPGATSALTNDGAGDYVDGVCGVKATVFSSSGDAVLQTDNPTLKPKRNDPCNPVYPRRLVLTHEHGTDSGPGGGQVGDVRGITVGVSAARFMALRIEGSACGRFLFQVDAGNGVSVTRRAEKAWEVSAPASRTARCEASGELLSVAAFTFTITAN